MKNSVQKEHELSRRRFMSGTACASLGTTGMVNTLAHLRMMNAAVASGGGPFTDYKALVVLFLFGGNDSYNTLIPSSNHPERQNYVDGRGILAHGDDPSNEGPVNGNNAAGNILRINYPSAANQQYGLHPELSGMRTMFNNGELAFLSNVGTLAEPVANRTEYLSGSKILPVQLFSHSNQQEQWQSSIPDKPFTSGWGGRMADLLNASYGSGDVSMSVTLSGVNSFQVGTSGDVVQYGVGVNGATSLAGFGTNYANALINTSGTFLDPNNYTNNDAGRRLRALESTMEHTLTMTGENLHEVGFESVLKRARQNEAFIGDAIATANAQLNFETLFSGYGATTGTANQLKMIAKLIAGRECLGNSRQIFFCSMGGFDNHRNMLPDHNQRMRELDPAVSAFNDAMKQIGAYNDVLLVSPSDFARTLTPNGNDPNSSGSDHAWGTNAFLSGGPVNGGQVYGQFPSLLTGDNAPLDAGSARGRFIPQTATDQFNALIAKWFGVSDNDMSTILPNLDRFDDPFTHPDLDMIDYTV